MHENYLQGHDPCLQSLATLETRGICGKAEEAEVQDLGKIDIAKMRSSTWNMKKALLMTVDMCKIFRNMTK